MKKENERQKLINKIMNDRYDDDDPKNDDGNTAFLDSLTIDELKELAQGF